MLSDFSSHPLAKTSSKDSISMSFAGLATLSFFLWALEMKNVSLNSTLQFKKDI